MASSAKSPIICQVRQQILLKQWISIFLPSDL